MIVPHKGDKMKAYQMKVTIRDSHPPIWRRIIVPEGYSFSQLAVIINQSFGWVGCHLFEFRIPSRDMCISEMDEEDYYDSWTDEELYDASTYAVDWEMEEKLRLVYTYDFGDDWRHDILVEKVLDPAPAPYPQVIKYKGDCPPEDCGGIYGYHLVETNEELKCLQLKGRKSKPKSYEELYEVYFANKNWTPVDFEKYGDTEPVDFDGFMEDPYDFDEEELGDVLFNVWDMMGIGSDTLPESFREFVTENADALMSGDKSVDDFFADDIIPVDEMQPGKNYIPPTKEQWKSLFETANDLKKIKPWEHITNENLVILPGDEDEEDIYVAVLGNGGIDYGFNFMFGYDGLERYLRIYEAEETGNSTDIALREQKMLSIWIAEKDLVPEDQREIMKELGLMPRGSAQWLAFMFMDPYHIPWSISQSEAEKLLPKLKLLFDGLYYYQETQLYRKTDPFDGIRLHYDEIGMPKAESVPYEELIRIFEAAMDLRSEVAGQISDIEKKRLEKQLKKCTRRPELHIDFRGTGMCVAPDPDDPDGRPLCPKIMIALDPETGMIVRHELVHSATEEPEAIRNIFAKWLSEIGIPNSVATPNEYLIEVLKPIVDITGMKCVYNESMPWMDEVFESFESF